MNNYIDTRPPFFPAKPENGDRPQVQGHSELKEKAGKRSKGEAYNESVQRNAKVEIPEGIKEFSRIKREVYSSPPIDNQAKIMDLRDRIARGTYEVDYDKVAEKLIEQEF